MRIADVAKEVALHLIERNAHPLAIFGHSMGAVVGFEVARRLQSAANMAPIALFASACRPPRVLATGRRRYDLPDDAFIEELRTLNGTPVEILKDPEMIKIMLPTLRADFKACQTYRYQPGDKLANPIIVYGGLGDPDISRQELEQWSQETRDDTIVRMFPGGHFYIHSAQTAVLNMLTRDLLHRIP